MSTSAAFELHKEMYNTKFFTTQETQNLHVATKALANMQRSIASSYYISITHDLPTLFITTTSFPSPPHSY